MDLTKFNKDNTKEFSLINMFMSCRIIDVYDGDTCTAILPIPCSGNDCCQFKIRLADIDTCEKRSKNLENKELALKAKKRLCELISNDFTDIDINISKNNLQKKLNEKCYIVKIKCGSFDKYGRLLAWIFNNTVNENEPNENSLNYILINEHLAYKYTGATKLSEEEQINLLTDLVKK